jgi:hypothetical protein
MEWDRQIQNRLMSRMARRIQPAAPAGFFAGVSADPAGAGKTLSRRISLQGFCKPPGWDKRWPLASPSGCLLAALVALVDSARPGEALRL